MCVQVCIHTGMCKCVCVYMCTGVYVYRYVQSCVCTQVCMYKYECVYRCMYTGMCDVCMCLQVCMICVIRIVYGVCVYSSPPGEAEEAEGWPGQGQPQAGTAAGPAGLLPH